MRHMYGSITAALALLVLLAWAAPFVTHATTRFSDEVTCPVCGFGFNASTAVSTNSFGGQDRDFLSHAAGEQVFLFECWTCPRCYYTGFPDDFANERVNPELIGQIREQKALKPAEKVAPPALRNSEDIPAWIRYDLLSQVLKLRKDATALDQAWAFLRTAQTQRFNAEAVSRAENEKTRLDSLVEKIQTRQQDKDPYRQTVMVARELERLAADGESEMAPEERPIALLYAARLYKSRGEDPDVRRVLALLEAQAKLSEDTRKGLDDLRVRMERERKYILLAIPLFERALRDGTVKAEMMPNVQYLVGELYRKVDEPAKATAVLKPLAAAKDLPEWLHSWILEALDKAGGSVAAKPELRP